MLVKANRTPGSQIAYAIRWRPSQLFQHNSSKRSGCAAVSVKLSLVDWDWLLPCMSSPKPAPWLPSCNLDYYTSDVVPYRREDPLTTHRANRIEFREGFFFSKDEVVKIWQTPRRCARRSFPNGYQSLQARTARLMSIFYAKYFVVFFCLSQQISRVAKSGTCSRGHHRCRCYQSECIASSQP